MKQSRPMKKKKKDRTWAEAATIVLEKSNGRSLGIREIQQKIYDMKLKDIKMNKLAENVLKTMLSHHSNIANCPFYKIKERSGYYALKTDGIKSASPASSVDGNSGNNYEDIDEDSNGSNSSSNRPITRRKVNVTAVDSPESPLAVQNGKNGDNNILIANVREKSIKSKNLAQKVLSNSVARRSNSYTGNPMQKSKKLLSRRRTSSPMSFSSLRSRTGTQQISRRSANLLATLSGGKSRTLPTLDLETPNSILTNTRLKSIINSAIFTMIPASYQYQLIQLLPKVDQDIDINGVPRISSTALNNEFYSQALQDWSTQLSEGEFTRETQARIMQEVAKERSKIQPWKEIFFEEYYGQKSEIKRTRSRSHDATSNLADLSFEAQVFKFQHLRDELSQNDIKTNNDQGDLVNIDSLVEDSESEHDPDYRTKINPPPTVQARKYPSSDNIKAPTKEIQLTKPINRRKNGKPFKRTMYNSIEAKRAPSLMHREMMLMQRRLPLYAAHTPILERFGIIANRSNFRMHGREFYNSESDLSDSGALSDSNNSFHEHDESDDDDSSDSMMNIGDDNLMDVDRDSESDEYEDMMNILPAHSVNAEHSYTRLPMVKRRHSANDDKRVRSQSWCQQMVIKPLSSDGLGQQSNSNTTLVLRPRGNLGQTVQSMNYSEDSSSTSPEQPYKKTCLTSPSFDKIVKVAKVETSREERVGVLFGRGVHSNSRAYTGDVIVPRIAPAEMFPVGRSGAVPCSSVTLTDSTANVLSSHMNSKTSVSKPTDKEQQLPTERSKPTMENEGCNNGTRKETQKNVPSLSSEDTRSLPKNTAFYITSTKVSTLASEEVTRPEPSTAVCRTLWPEQRDGTAVGETVTSSVLKQSEGRMVEHAEDIILPQIPAVMKIVDTVKTVHNSPIYKRRALPATNASPVKRTRTLAEIKAQMKAKKAAAAASASPLGSTGRISSLQNSPLRKIAQSSSTTPSSLTSTVVHALDVETKPVEEYKDPCQTPGTEVSGSEKNKDVTHSVLEENTERCSDRISSQNLEDNRQNIDEKDEQLKQDDTQTSSKIPGIIIMKIKAEEGKKYTVKLKSKRGNSSDSKDSDSNSDSDEIVRNTKKLRKIISSSDDSSVASTPKAALDRDQSPVCSSVTGAKPRSATPQPPVAGMYMAKVTSIVDHPMLFKKTQKSPVFGEPAFDSISVLAGGIPQMPAVTDDLSSLNPQSGLQPFMSDKPVIGFQDIPLCAALSSSNVQTTVASFTLPTGVVQPTKEAQKYRSTSKGKSLVQMQQMARNNQIYSDESEMAESESEENDSTASSAEEEDDWNSSMNHNLSSLTDTDFSSSKTLRNRHRKSSDQKNMVNHNSVMESDEVDSYYSSSDDPGITECICSCKRLVLCKGCGAYTHQECLSASSLCSLCV